MNLTTLTLTDIKIMFYKLLLAADHSKLTEGELDILYILSEDEQIQDIFKKNIELKSVDAKI